MITYSCQLTLTDYKATMRRNVTEVLANAKEIIGDERYGRLFGLPPSVAAHVVAGQSAAA